MYISYLYKEYYLSRNWKLILECQLSYVYCPSVYRLLDASRTHPLNVKIRDVLVSMSHCHKTEIDIQCFQVHRMLFEAFCYSQFHLKHLFQEQMKVFKPFKIYLFSPTSTLVDLNVQVYRYKRTTLIFLLIFVSLFILRNTIILIPINLSICC